MGQRIQIFSILLIILSSCSTSTVEDILTADRNFSLFSAEKGMKKAFMEYADDSLVLLRSNSLPIVGKNALMSSFEKFSDEGFILTWEPLSGEISKSGDMGYTYGIFTTKLKGDSIVQKGTYVSIWKKQSDGTWKFVLDTGNEGI